MFAKQYEVWEARGGKPRAIKCQAAIGMSRVKIDGMWFNRNEGGIFDTKAECQQWIDSFASVPRPQFKIDSMFRPVVVDE